MNHFERYARYVFQMLFDEHESEYRKANLMPTNTARTSHDLVKDNQVLGYHTFFLKNANHCELKLNTDGSMTFSVDKVLLVKVDKIDVTTMLDEQNLLATSYTRKSMHE